MRYSGRGRNTPRSRGGVPFWAKLLYTSLAFGNIVMRVFYAFYNRKHLLKALEDDERIEVIFVNKNGETKAI